MRVAETGPILLAHSYFLRYDDKQLRKMKPYPPLATLIVAARLRQLGRDVRLFDAMLASGVEEYLAILRAVRPRIVLLVEDNFNFLTKMCTLRMREAAFEMIGAARAQGCFVAVNGSDATDREMMYIEAGADTVIVGEPEDTVVELVEAVSASGDYDITGVEGLALRPRGNESAPIHTPQRRYRRDLDALPLPAWDLIDAEAYRSAWQGAHGRLSWNVVTSRGCPYKCNWCAKPLFGTRYAQRSPGNVALEFERLKNEVRPGHIWFADDIFGLTAEWIDGFAREVVARDARIPFLMQSRANLMKPKVVAALANAGAEEVWLGAESGSQRILDAMDKGSTIEQVREATRNLHAHGIKACWFIQLGYRGEEWDDILQTRDLIRDEQPDDIGVSVSYPLPGTKFYDLVKAELGDKTNWNDSDDLAMLFRGTYESEFYRTTRELLHDEVSAGWPVSPKRQREFEARWRDLELAEAASRTQQHVTT